jgi:hypothetical protein
MRTGQIFLKFSNDTTVNPPLFSLVNTFIMTWFFPFQALCGDPCYFVVNLLILWSPPIKKNLEHLPNEEGDNLLTIIFYIGMQLKLKGTVSRY